MVMVTNENKHSYALQINYINTNDTFTKNKQAHMILKVGQNKQQLMCKLGVFLQKRKK